MATTRIETLPVSDLEAALDDMLALLRVCVDAGGSLGFLSPLPDPDAAAYWKSLVPLVQSGNRIIFVAREEPQGRIVGSAQLALETKPNGRHRGEVCKVMVAPSQRHRGIAAQLMEELERCARERGIRVLVLDTSEGSSGARKFYDSLGYTYIGGIPDYALDPAGVPTTNAIYFKTLSPPPEA